MLIKLKRRMDELRTSTKKIYKKKSYLKNTVTEMKNTQEGINNMLEDGKEWIRDL